MVGCCCWLEFRQAVQRPPAGAKMCGTKEILLKNVRGKGNPIEILEKTSQSEPHPSPRPRDPWKSWKKPHNLRTIPWTSGNPGKNLTICGPSPGPPEILEKNLTILRICLVVGCWLVPTSCAEATYGGKNDLCKKLLRDGTVCRPLINRL